MYSSFKLGGYYLIHALNQMGIKSYSGEHVAAGNLRDAILVFVKDNIPENLDELKANNNKIVIDMRDNFILKNGALHPDFIGRDAADYLIFPNQALLDKFLSINDTTSNCIVLYGFADPAITSLFLRKGYRKRSRLKCCYFGFNNNLFLQPIENAEDITSVELIPLTESNFDECVEKLYEFNMHIDFRQNEYANEYKPLTKILIAAQCASNIIIKKSPRVLEMLPVDYPFLIDENNLESIMKKAAALFNKKEWEDALKVMEGIRKEFSFQNHINEFINILEKLS